MVAMISVGGCGGDVVTWLTVDSLEGPTLLGGGECMIDS